MHLEVVALVALGLADLGQPREQPVQLLAVAAGVHPAVALDDGAAQGGVAVPADQQRDLLGGRGALLERRERVELAVVAEEVLLVLGSGQAAQDVHALVHPLAAPRPRDAEGLEVLGPRGQPDAEAEPVAGQEGDRRGLLGDEHRRPHRQLQHERREPERRGDGREVGGQHHRLDELLVLEELPVAGVGVGVLRVRLLRVDQAVRDRHARVAGRLGRLGQGCVVRRLGHRLGVGESHAPTLERVPVFWKSGRCGPAADLRPPRDRGRADPLHAGHRHGGVGRPRHRLHARRGDRLHADRRHRRQLPDGQGVAGREPPDVPAPDAHARPGRDPDGAGRRRGGGGGVLLEPDDLHRRPTAPSCCGSSAGSTTTGWCGPPTAGAAASCSRSSSGSAASDGGRPRSGSAPTAWTPRSCRR